MAKKAKRVRTEKQLANDQRLRDQAALKKETPLDPPFVPAPEDVLPIKEIAPLTEGGTPSPKSDSPFAQAPQVDKDAMMLELMQGMMEMMKSNQGFKIDEKNVAAVIDETSKIQYAGGRAPQATVGQNGVTGQVFKYPVEREYYPNPVERLYDLPFLKRHNLRDNYILTWDVEGVEFEKNGIAFAEPRFIVHLYRRIYDEDGLDSNTVALVSRNFLHEDRFIALQTANKMGITKNFADEREIMDEVRFIRIKGWLEALFTPYKFQTFKKKARSMVVGGKQVEVFDTESIIDAEAADSQASSLRIGR